MRSSAVAALVPVLSVAALLGLAGCSAAPDTSEPAPPAATEPSPPPAAANVTEELALGPGLQLAPLPETVVARSLDLRAWRAPTNSPLFYSTWQYVGTYTYFGGAQSFLSPINPSRVATHLLLEAPLSCAPRVVSLAVTTTPFNNASPVAFQGQRYLGAVVQALYAIGGTTIVTGVSATFTGWPVAQSCPVRFYTVYAL